MDVSSCAHFGHFPLVIRSSRLWTDFDTTLAKANLSDEVKTYIVQALAGDADSGLAPKWKTTSEETLASPNSFQGYLKACRGVLAQHRSP
ncbi:hypothetical protein [uncultured Phyllobacterium sp.]|uniref:hypothetical protein n=1 Tax=uncultured Phyllobacterium sp. TaxID=253813 RepID=UPI00258E0DC1|nr:hypothetical protein [uncultured Phyllobacterium sp.]